jgi:hypothetical protein
MTHQELQPAVWRNSLECVNGFDGSFMGWGHEDSDLVMCLLHAGSEVQGRRLRHRGVPPVAPRGAARLGIQQPQRGAEAGCEQCHACDSGLRKHIRKLKVCMLRGQSFGL